MRNRAEKLRDVASFMGNRVHVPRLHPELCTSGCRPQCKSKPSDSCASKLTFPARTQFLGITEGGLLPGIVLFLSMVYTRREMGFRMGLIYGAASLSGAFGGLLAYGLDL